MKIKLALVIILLIFPNGVFAKEPIKVAVLPWSINLYIKEATDVGLLKQDDNLFKQVKTEFEKAIKSKAGFTISSKDFGDTEEDAANFFFPNGIPSVPFPGKKQIYDADLVVFIQSPEKDADKYTALMIVAVETGKEATSLIEDAKITNENLSSIIAQRISKGLDFANNLLNVKADEIIDPERSLVRYIFTSSNSQKVFMDIDYDGVHEKVQNVALVPSEKNVDGEVIYELPTDKKAKIIITLLVKSNKAQSAHIDTDFRPAANSTDSDVFFVESDKGFPVKVTFDWEGQNIKNVNIAPKGNPYEPLEPLTF